MKYNKIFESDDEEFFSDIYGDELEQHYKVDAEKYIQDLNKDIFSFFNLSYSVDFEELKKQEPREFSKVYSELKKIDIKQVYNPDYLIIYNDEIKLEIGSKYFNYYFSILSAFKTNFTCKIKIGILTISDLSNTKVEYQLPKNIFDKENISINLMKFNNYTFKNLSGIPSNIMTSVSFSNCTIETCEGFNSNKPIAIYFTNTKVYRWTGFPKVIKNTFSITYDLGYGLPGGININFIKNRLVSLYDFPLHVQFIPNERGIIRGFELCPMSFNSMDDRKAYKAYIKELLNNTNMSKEDKAIVNKCFNKNGFME